MITIPQAEMVLRELRVKKPREFSSHDFIEEYSAQYETEYIDWLCTYRGTGLAFQTVHGRIGRFLSEKEGKIVPRYKRTRRADSESCHGTIDQPMWWEWE